LILAGAELPCVMGEAPELDLPGLAVACPLCGQVHARCRFTAGSLYCTVEGAGIHMIARYHTMPAVSRFPPQPPVRCALVSVVRSWG
jgi:hypothetical protein